MSEAENKDMETFEIELPDEFIEKHFGLGLSEETLAKKIEEFLLNNIAHKNKEPIISSYSSSTFQTFSPSNSSFCLDGRKSLKL